MKKVRINNLFKTDMGIATMERALADLKSQVPKEFHDKVCIEFDWEEDYGCYRVAIDVYYTRPNTEEEDEKDELARQRVKDLRKIELRRQLDELGG